MSAVVDDDYQHFVSGILERADNRGFAHLSAMQVVFALTTTTSQVTYDLEATVHRPRGLSWAAYRLLVVLAVSGPLDPTRAAPRAAMSRAAVSALAKTLERDGLINRKPSTVDGRSVVLSLTRRGRSVFADAKAANNEREEAWCAVLAESERRQLVTLLRKLANQPSSTSVRQRG